MSSSKFICHGYSRGEYINNKYKLSRNEEGIGKYVKKTTFEWH